MNISRRQASQIRRGILLARHDDAVARLKVRHQESPTDITEALLEVYTDAEKIMLDAGPLTKLTMRAYHRVYNRMTPYGHDRVDSPKKAAYTSTITATKGQNHDIQYHQRGSV